MEENSLQALEWLKAAKDDLDSIDYIIQAEHLTNIAAFHAQQAIEKSFKALMEHRKIAAIKTHNLERLYPYVENLIEVDEELLRLVNELYIESRYPGDMGLLPHGKPTLEDAREFHAFARDLFEQVCDLLEIDKDALREK